MMTRRRVVRTSRELWALTSPERQEIVQVLLGSPPMSVRELGEALGRLPVSLYYHLRKLERSGLVVRTGTRAATKGEEALYGIPARELVIQPDRRGPREVTALRKIGGGMFRRAKRLHDAMIAEVPPQDRRRREHTLAQRTVRVDAEGLQRLNERILDLLDLLERTPACSDGNYYTVTVHLARDLARH
jgi:DNA-binding transcriptional ArsR family regulator